MCVFPRLSRLLIAAVAFVLLGGPAVAAEKTVVFSWASNAGKLNPHMYSPNQMYAQNMLYESLVRYAPGGRIEPWLAESWDISSDGKAYTFHLRKGVVFSDGLLFDAEAVRKNVEAVLANRKRHAWLELVAQIDGVDVIDPHTVRFRFKGAYYPVLQELALVRPLRFLSPAAIPESGSTAESIKAPIGTGPWKLAEIRRGEYDIFVVNDRYWGPKPHIDKVIVKVIPDPNTRAVAFETGAIDLIFGVEGQISADTFARFRDQKRYTTAVSDAMATRSLALNSNRGATRELAVRRAINHAVDKDAIIANILYGIQPKADTLFAKNFPYTDVGLRPYSYHPGLAARLLDEAGWTLAPGAKARTKNGVPLRVEFCFVGSDAQEKAMAEVIQANLAKVGIDVALLGEEKNSFYARQKDGSFDIIFSNTWGAPYDPHSFVSSMRVPSHADYQAQRGLPMKPDIDRMIGEVLVSVDETARQALYTKILTTLHEQAVYVPISYVTSIMVHGPKLSNVGFGATKWETPFNDLSVN